MAKEWARPLYNSKAWTKVREYILKRDGYMCQCHKLIGGDECGLPAEEVHHIIHLNAQNVHDARIALGEDNLIALSRSCHVRLHQIEDGRKKTDCGDGLMFDENGMLVEVSHESR